MNKFKLAVLLSLTALATLMQTNAQTTRTFDYDAIAPHPRLMLLGGEEEAIKQMIDVRENRYLLAVHQQIIDSANAALTAKCYTRPPSGHILAISRNILQRIFHLAYAYRMTGYYRYAERAEEEMLNACAFNSWDPEHFLDVAELALGVAIGYDWLYDYLSEPTKATIRQALYSKCIEPSYKADFYEMRSNWNQVCNCGVVCAALAVFEEMPEVAIERIERSVASNPKSQLCYEPDGGYPEGYTYWGYGTGFEVMMLASLESALGSDAGLSQTDGFMKTAEFIEFMSTPLEYNFTFSDSQPKATCSSIVFWFSWKLDDPSLLYLEKRRLNSGKANFDIETRHLPCLLIFASKQDMARVAAPTKNTWVGHGPTPVYIYRGGWDSKNDTYLAVKGGQSKYSHAHMDSGSFYFEKGGVRWAMDLGGQSYGGFYKHNISIWDSSQNGQRYDILRISSPMHNTLTINGGRHNVEGYADIIEVWDSPEKHGCRVDLSETFSLQLAAAERDVYLNADETELHVVDNITTYADQAEIYWNMTTTAKPKVESTNSIILSKGGHRLRLEVMEPDDATMQILSTQPTTVYDAANPGTCRVGFTVTVAGNTSAAIHARLTYLE